MKVPLKTLYFLDDEEISLMEVKLTNLPAGTDKSKVFFWLVFDKSNKQKNTF